MFNAKQTKANSVNSKKKKKNRQQSENFRAHKSEPNNTKASAVECHLA
jgi:hypothetical protein